MPGVLYYVRALACCSNSASNLAFNVECIEPAENDLCENSIPINCGEIIEGSTFFASETNMRFGCTFEGTPDLWYTIIGDGQLYQFELLTSVTGQLIIEVLQGEQCGTYNTCDQELIGVGGTFNFVAQQGLPYQIQITHGSGFPTLGEFSFEITCLTPPSNDNCSTAEQLVCGTLIEGSTEFASIEQDLQILNCGNTFDNDVWYSFLSLIHI